MKRLVASIRKGLQRPLGVRETALAALVVILLEVLGYGAYRWVGEMMLEARVAAAVPKLATEIREQGRTVEAAIEAYKAHFGCYPPDHVLRRQPLTVDAVTNPLLYELAGVRYNPTNQDFEVGSLEPANAQYVKDFFHSDGFKNSTEQAGEVKHFLPLGDLPAQQLHDDPDVFALGFNLPWGEFDQEVLVQIKVTPWRYVSSAPTNNPGRFDLWCELQTKGKRIIIGNWAVVK